MILWCQKIWQMIHKKMALAIMGMDSEGDHGVALDSEASEKEEEVVAVLGDMHGGDDAIGTPIGLVDGGAGVVVDGGVGIIGSDKVGFSYLTPCCYTTIS